MHGRSSFLLAIYIRLFILGNTSGASIFAAPSVAGKKILVALSAPALTPQKIHNGEIRVDPFVSRHDAVVEAIEWAAKTTGLDAKTFTVRRVVSDRDGALEKIEISSSVSLCDSCIPLPDQKSLHDRIEALEADIKLMKADNKLMKADNKLMKADNKLMREDKQIANALLVIQDLNSALSLGKYFGGKGSMAIALKGARTTRVAGSHFLLIDAHVRKPIQLEKYQSANPNFDNRARLCLKLKLICEFMLSKPFVEGVIEQIGEEVIEGLTTFVATITDDELTVGAEISVDDRASVKKAAKHFFKFFPDFAAKIPKLVDEYN